jgi:tRNA(Ile)-lysidine synthase
MPAGRMGSGLLMMREEAAMAPPEAATPGVSWDGRFRVMACPEGLQIGALGEDAARFRDRNRLPTAVLRTLPAFRRNGTLVAVPHLLYSDVAAYDRPRVTFAPPRPACGGPFLGGSMARAA